ncbi:hypothetical protein KC366_g28 [Hortaea werneckii]|nr:hypothetical protein KC366_g28 [Hortaea werneckii]
MASGVCYRRLKKRLLRERLCSSGEAVERWQVIVQHPADASVAWRLVPELSAPACTSPRSNDLRFHIRFHIRFSARTSLVTVLCRQSPLSQHLL